MLKDLILANPKFPAVLPGSCPLIAKTLEDLVELARCSASACQPATAEVYPFLRPQNSNAQIFSSHSLGWFT